VSDPTTCIGVHCVTGLGRAPVLVATALIELGMKYEDAVEMIRKKRRGAINAKQLEFLAKYKKRNYFVKRSNKCKIQWTTPILFDSSKAYTLSVSMTVLYPLYIVIRSMIRCNISKSINWRVTFSIIFRANWP